MQELGDAPTCALNVPNRQGFGSDEPSVRSTQDVGSVAFKPLLCLLSSMPRRRRRISPRQRMTHCHHEDQGSTPPYREANPL